ncbi:hypothetical protein RKD32_005642 [Streptomyces sp. SAI-195]|uniref:hypothetical protein n=1 Tax=Streptomyces sp. SAI-195 TaxID=3377734 RepID=UPI003C7ADC9B
MCAWDQARDQLSKFSLSGSDQGEPKMEASSLKEVITAHTSGMPTMIAQMTRTPWEKTLRVVPSFFPSFSPPGAAWALMTGVPGSAGTGAGVSVVFIDQYSSRSRRPSRITTAAKASVTTSRATPMVVA